MVFARLSTATFAFCLMFLLAGEWKELEHSPVGAKFSHPVGVLWPWIRRLWMCWYEQSSQGLGSSECFKLLSLLWKDVADYCILYPRGRILSFFWLHPCVAYRILLVPWLGIEPKSSAVKAQNPNHWTAWEFPKTLFYCCSLNSSVLLFLWTFLLQAVVGILKVLSY